MSVSICLSVYLSVCLSVYLSICLSVCLTMSVCPAWPVSYTCLLILMSLYWRMYMYICTHTHMLTCTYVIYRSIQHSKLFNFIRKYPPRWLQAWPHACMYIHRFTCAYIYIRTCIQKKDKHSAKCLKTIQWIYNKKTWKWFHNSKFKKVQTDSQNSKMIQCIYNK